MDMQMQLKRGLIAVMVWAALGGLVLSRAATPADADGQHAPLLIPALASSRDCGKHLRIELTASLRVTVPCDHSCGPIRNIARLLHLPAATSGDVCATWRTA